VSATPWLLKSPEARARGYLRGLGYGIAQNNQPLTSWVDRWWVGLFQKHYNRMVDRGVLGLPVTVDGWWGNETAQAVGTAWQLQGSEHRSWQDILKQQYNGLGDPPPYVVDVVDAFGGVYRDVRYRLEPLPLGMIRLWIEVGPHLPVMPGSVPSIHADDDGAGGRQSAAHWAVVDEVFQTRGAAIARARDVIDAAGGALDIGDLDAHDILRTGGVSRRHSPATFEHSLAPGSTGDGFALVAFLALVGWAVWGNA
jgi:hypothetical protein